MSEIKTEWREYISAIDKSISIDVLTEKTLNEWMEPLIQSITNDGAIPYLLDTQERYRASPLASAISWLEKANLVPMTVLTTMQEELLWLRDKDIQDDPHPGNNQKRPEDAMGWSLGEGVSVWSTSCAIEALLDSHGNGCANALQFKNSVLWLANQRNKQGAWAYQLFDNCIPSVPMTSLALRALAQAYMDTNRQKFQFSREDEFLIERAIRDGYNYLKSTCVITKTKACWNFQDKANCAATTWALLALHRVNLTNAEIANDCRGFYEKIREKALAFVCSQMPKKSIKWPEELFVHEGGAKYAKQKNYASFSATLLPQLFELGVSAFHPRVIKQIKWLIENPEEWKISTYDKGKICYFTYAMVLSTITEWLQRVGLTLAPMLIKTSKNKIPRFLYGYNSTRNADVQVVLTKNITIASSVVILLIIFLLFGKQIDSWTDWLSAYIISFWQKTENERYDVIVGVISNILETGIMFVLLLIWAFAKKCGGGYSMFNLTILKDLSRQLNQHNITWGIGGSCLLMLYNLYSAPNDLDLWVQPDDIEKVREIFAACEEIPTDIPLPKELHYKMLFHNVEVDFVACFIIKPNQHQYRFDICPENIRMITVGDMQVPCTFLEDWFIIYQLLNRTEKAKLIQDYFSEHQIEFDKSAIDRAIQHKEVSLPSRLEHDIRLLVFDATQLSFHLPVSDIEIKAKQDYLAQKGTLRKKARQEIPILFLETTQLSFPLFEDEESCPCVLE